MIDQNQIRANLDDWLKNPSWREVYDDAPTEACRKYLALMFYASETEEDVVFDAMDAQEANLSLVDLKYLMQVMQGPEKARLAKKIAEMEPDA